MKILDKIIQSKEPPSSNKVIWLKDNTLYGYKDGEWTTLGISDLSNYYTKDEIDQLLSEYTSLEALATTLANYSTTSQMNSAISAHHDSSKQDTISDLSTIRSGASLGATALQSVPSNYATKTEKSTPTSASSYELNYDKVTALGTLTGEITLTLATLPEDGYAHFYMVTFTAGSTAPTLSYPEGISWAGGNAPTITAGKYYEIYFMDNKVSYLEY